jgi:hypothetical protein
LANDIGARRKSIFTPRKREIREVKQGTEELGSGYKRPHATNDYSNVEKYDQRET